MSLFEILECKEKERREYYELKVKIEIAEKSETISCVVCKSYNSDSGRVDWSVISTEPEDLGEPLWDALAENALEDLVGAEMWKDEKSKAEGG